MKILVINGPNLNMLGTREPEIYGTTTLDDINKDLFTFAHAFFDDVELDFFQSNHEGDIVTKIQSARSYDGLIINPAAYTHTSVAIADAIKATGVKTVEVHLSNVGAREEFRQISYLRPNCLGVVSGFKANSYKLALLGLYNDIKGI